MTESDDSLIREQIEYYDRRASEYDATSRPPGDPHSHENEELMRALEQFEPAGRVLEIACGTGWWTSKLLAHADHVTALDASASMLELNRSRNGDEGIRYVRSDVFDWTPDGTYDVVFFSFWLSHVPPDHFERFWSMVERCLRPEGRAFFMDEADAEGLWRDEEYLTGSDYVVSRPLLDGTRFRAVKVFWKAPALEKRLREWGWDARVTSTGVFYWGVARR